MHISGADPLMCIPDIQQAEVDTGHRTCALYLTLALNVWKSEMYMRNVFEC